jgi:hypothetical protein
MKGLGAQGVPSTLARFTKSARSYDAWAFTDGDALVRRR